MPSQSRRGRFVVLVCDSSVIAPKSATAQRIRLTYSVQRQFAYSVRKPPSSRPTDAPEPAIAPKMPNAFARSFGSLNVVVSRLRMAGASSAANTPWAARAVTSMPKLRAAPPTALAIAKPVAPMTSVHLRPKTSAMRPPIRNNEPKLSA